MAENENQKPETMVREIYERLPRGRLILAAYALVALIIAILIVFGVRAIYRHNHNPTVKTVPANTKQLPSAPSPSAENNKNKNSAESQSLPNSGPGQVVGLFVGVSLVSTGLHYVYELRNAEKLT